MNSIEKRKMLEGVLYNFHVPGRISNEQVDVLITIKDLLRKNGLVASCNDYGQIEILEIDSRREVARALFI